MPNPAAGSRHLRWPGAAAAEDTELGAAWRAADTGRVPQAHGRIAASIMARVVRFIPEWSPGTARPSSVRLLNLWRCSNQHWPILDPHRRALDGSSARG